MSDDMKFREVLVLWLGASLFVFGGIVVGETNWDALSNWQILGYALVLMVTGTVAHELFSWAYRQREIRNIGKVRWRYDHTA